MRPVSEQEQVQLPSKVCLYVTAAGLEGSDNSSSRTWGHIHFVDSWFYDQDHRRLSTGSRNLVATTNLETVGLARYPGPPHPFHNYPDPGFLDCRRILGLDRKGFGMTYFK